MAVVKEQQTFVDALESEAKEQLSAIREARIYKGKDPDYRQRAKLAIGVIGAYVRLRATMANEHTNRLVEMRLLGGGREDGAEPQMPYMRKAVSAAKS